MVSVWQRKMCSQNFLCTMSPEVQKLQVIFMSFGFALSCRWSKHQLICSNVFPSAGINSMAIIWTSGSLLGIVVLRILPDQCVELQALHRNFMILYKVIQWWMPMVFFLKFSPSCQVSTIWASWKYRHLLHDGIRWLNGLIVPTYQLTWYQKVLITSNWKFYDDIWAIWISQDDAGRNVVCINGMPLHLHHLARYQELLIKVIWKWYPMLYDSI